VRVFFIERLTPHLSARQRGENNRFDDLILFIVLQPGKAAVRERFGKRRTIEYLNTLLRHSLDD
jgi:hypothetical protein